MVELWPNWNASKEADLFGARNKGWTIDQWQTIWYEKSKLGCFSSNCLFFLRCRKCEQTVSKRAFPTAKHEGGGVGSVVYFTGDTVGDFSKLRAPLTSMATIAFAAICYPILFALGHHLFFNSSLTPNALLVCKIFFFTPSPLHQHQIQLIWFRISWTRDSRKSIQYVLNTSGNSFKIVGKLFQVFKSWGWLKKCQECGKMSSKQKVAT